MPPLCMAVCMPAELSAISVMSGVITGPYFMKFFNDPSALAVGTMVAVLEIGAFSMPETSLRPYC